MDARQWLPAASAFYDDMRQQPARNASVVDSGDVDETLRTAAVVLRATYRHPYQMHGSMGTSCAVADVSEGRAKNLVTDAIGATRTVAMILGLPPENVRVIYVRGSGCYGINGADTVSYDAAVMSHAVGRPVRVQLSRHDEMAWENYGFAYVIDQRVALDAKGSIVAWDCESWNAALGGRPGYETPGNVITGSLLGFFQRRSVHARSHRHRPPSTMAATRRPRYVAGCVRGSCGSTSGEERTCITHTIRSPFFTGPLRSPSRLQEHVRARIGHGRIGGTRPGRSRRLSTAPLARRAIDRGVLKAAATAARWETRPSPRPSRRPNGRTRSRGIACVLYEGDNGYCAMVAEVEVDQDTGTINVTRLVASGTAVRSRHPMA